MNHNLLYHLGSLAGALPYVAIVGILVHFAVRRSRCKRAVRRGSNPGFYPSTAALGTVFLLTQVLYRPSLQHLIEARQVVEAEEDDNGEPDAPGKLDRQLRRLRRGEQVEKLILRL